MGDALRQHQSERSFQSQEGQMDVVTQLSDHANPAIVEVRYRDWTVFICPSFAERRVRVSRIGVCPKRRLYSRVNWLALS